MGRGEQVCYKQEGVHDDRIGYDNQKLDRVNHLSLISYDGVTMRSLMRKNDCSYRFLRKEEGRL